MLKPIFRTSWCVGLLLLLSGCSKSPELVVNDKNCHFVHWLSLPESMGKDDLIKGCIAFIERKAGNEINE